MCIKIDHLFMVSVSTCYRNVNRAATRHVVCNRLSWVDTTRLRNILLDHAVFYILHIDLFPEIEINRPGITKNNSCWSVYTWLYHLYNEGYIYLTLAYRQTGSCWHIISISTGVQWYTPKYMRTPLSLWLQTTIHFSESHVIG